jgi:hypothetical protein
MPRLERDFTYAVGGVKEVHFVARDYQEGEMPADAEAYAVRKGLIKPVETKQVQAEETKDKRSSGKKARR